MSSRHNVFYAQSGGPTAVINASAAGVIETARAHPKRIARVYAGRNGILGALNEDMIDVNRESSKTIAALRHTPGAAFGTCRYKLKGLNENRAEYERLLDVFEAHNIGYFLYNGGGDSQDTARKVAQLARRRNSPIRCIGIPKTVDNDLPVTDNCPGFGSVAKYVATSIREAGLDVASMAATSTKVFILEVMGRHAGWIAAAGGLASTCEGEPPHIILFPEIPFNRRKFLSRVKACVKEYGYCAIVASEGVRDGRGRFLAESGSRDAFGHAQLGGSALVLANLISKHLGYKNHWAVADYLQRSASHIASQVDCEQAYAVGRAAMRLALLGKTAIMPTIVRTSNRPYRWKIGTTPISRVANRERMMPRNFIHEDGFGITPRCRTYLEPLIRGEATPSFRGGLPQYARLKGVRVAQKLPPFST